MPALAPRRIPNVVIGLSLFWSGIVSAFLWTEGFNFSFVVPWFLSILMGIWLSQYRSEAYKNEILTRLNYREKEKLPITDRYAFESKKQGVICSIGPLPFQYPPLERVEAYTINDLKEHCPPELANGILDTMIGDYLRPGRTTENHIALFNALVKTLLHPEHVKIPAGIDRHGKRSLITHSLLVCGLMIHRAPGFVYKTGSLAPIDRNFKLNPLDPLLPIIGLAHDIGKLRSFNFDKDGRPISLRPDHDAHSARMVALLPEFWSPSFDITERSIMQAALAYFHKLSSVPIQKTIETKYLKKSEDKAPPTVTSDRLYAILTLLKECDRLASTIELGQTYKFAEEAPVLEIEPMTEEDFKEDLRDTFANFIATSMNINATGAGVKSVAFKYKSPEFSNDRDILIFDERYFVDLFTTHMGKSAMEAGKGKKINPLTEQILLMLDENGYLFRPKEEILAVGQRTAINCTFSVEFFDLNTSSETPALVMKPAFLVDITDWPRMKRLREMSNCRMTPKVGHNIMGNMGVKRITRVDVSATDSAKIMTAEDLISARSESNPVKVSEPKIVTIDYDKVIHAIKLSLSSKKLKVAMNDDTGIGIVGSDSFFQQFGIDLNTEVETIAKAAPYGITKILKSKTIPNSHVVVLDKNIYGH